MYYSNSGAPDMPWLALNQIPDPPIAPPASTEDGKQLFNEGFQFGYIAGVSDPSNFTVDQDAIQRGAVALFPKVFGIPWDGRDHRIVPIREYARIVLTAAYGDE